MARLAFRRTAWVDLDARHVARRVTWLDAQPAKPPSAVHVGRRGNGQFVRTVTRFGGAGLAESRYSIERPRLRDQGGVILYLTTETRAFSAHEKTASARPTGSGVAPLPGTPHPLKAGTALFPSTPIDTRGLRDCDRHSSEFVKSHGRSWSRRPERHDPGQPHAARTFLEAHPKVLNCRPTPRGAKRTPRSSAMSSLAASSPQLAIYALAIQPSQRNARPIRWAYSDPSRRIKAASRSSLTGH